jgi:Ion channel
VTTIATVGYGDVVPHEHRAIFAATFLVSVVLFAFLLGESVALLSEIHNYRRLDAFFARGLTPEILDSMDAFRDGQVRVRIHLLATLASLQNKDAHTS